LQCRHKGDKEEDDEDGDDKDDPTLHGRGRMHVVSQGQPDDDGTTAPLYTLPEPPRSEPLFDAPGCDVVEAAANERGKKKGEPPGVVAKKK
jgi:hypothetical protein